MSPGSGPLTIPATGPKARAAWSGRGGFQTRPYVFSGPSMVSLVIGCHAGHRRPLHAIAYQPASVGAGQSTITQGRFTLAGAWARVALLCRRRVVSLAIVCPQSSGVPGHRRPLHYGRSLVLANQGNMRANGSGQ